MKNILCFGDSNTWGAIPANVENRFPREVRWTGRLQQLLGNEYYVIEEGLNGRTTVIDDPIEPHRCGKFYLTPCLLSHRPLNAVILMLGTNDLKYRFSYSAHDIARGAALLVEMILKSECGLAGRPPKVLLVSPAPLTHLTADADEFAGGQAKSKLLAHYYQLQASLLGCDFLDAGQVVAPSDLDGVHLNQEQHQKLARAFADRILGWQDW